MVTFLVIVVIVAVFASVGFFLGALSSELEDHKAELIIYIILAIVSTAIWIFCTVAAVNISNRHYAQTYARVCHAAGGRVIPEGNNTYLCVKPGSDILNINVP